MSRLADLEANLETVRARIGAACDAAHRGRDEVGLVAVTKTWPAADVRLLHELGLRDMGENKAQEGTAKAADVAGLPGLRWHFVGGLQTNKAARVARWADVVQSVDRIELVELLSRGAVEQDRSLDVLVQVSLDGDPARGGVARDRLLPIAAAVAAAPGLHLRGVMAVAPIGQSAARAFAELRTAAEALRREHPQAVTISAGMSSDLEEAIAEGSTSVRVGTALLGRRRPLVSYSQPG